MDCQMSHAFSSRFALTNRPFDDGAHNMDDMSTSLIEFPAGKRAAPMIQTAADPVVLWSATPV